MNRGTRGVTISFSEICPCEEELFAKQRPLVPFSMSGTAPCGSGKSWDTTQRGAVPGRPERRRKWMDGN